MVEYFFLVFRFLVILTFLLINFQLWYYYRHTGIPEFGLLFFRFLFGIVVLFQVNFVFSEFSLKLFLVLFVTVYVFLLLFMRRVVRDLFSLFLLFVYAVLFVVTFFLEPVPSGSSFLGLPFGGVRFISFSGVIGFSVGGVVVFTSEHPWPYIFFRLVVDLYLLMRIFLIDALDVKSKSSWLFYIGLHGVFDFLFLFSLDGVRLFILLVANVFFFLMVWQRPHSLVLTNPQLISLYGRISGLREMDDGHVPFTNSQELIDYISHVGELMNDDG